MYKHNQLGYEELMAATNVVLRLLRLFLLDPLALG